MVPLNSLNDLFRIEDYSSNGNGEKPKDFEGHTSGLTAGPAKKSVYQGLGWLDRFLALWILLAIIVGILLGNYIDSVDPALQRGKFVQVSVPIGM